jgi:hypothetical protein
MSPTWPDLENASPDLCSLLRRIDHPRTEVDPELPAPIAEAPRMLPSHAPLRGNPSASRLGRHGFRVSSSALTAGCEPGADLVEPITQVLGSSAVDNKCADGRPQP